MIDYRLFLPEVMPYAPNCSEPMAIGAIRNACIEFCDRSGWLQALLVAQDVTAATYAYTLTVPAEMTLANVIEVFFQGQRLTAKSEDELAGMFGRNWRDVTGTPAFYCQDDMAGVQLCPVPDESITAGLRVQVALRPTRASTTVDSSIYEWWSETIAAGALARLLSTVGQPFSNMEGSTYYNQKFHTGFTEARRRRNASLTRGPLAVQMPVFI